MDMVKHPPHYNAHPSGVEAIDLCEHLSFNLGNALKYAWRAGIKAADPAEDLRKCIWYLEREDRLIGLDPEHVSVQRQVTCALLAAKAADKGGTPVLMAFFRVLTTDPLATVALGQLVSVAQTELGLST